MDFAEFTGIYVWACIYDCSCIAEFLGSKTYLCFQVYCKDLLFSVLELFPLLLIPSYGWIYVSACFELDGGLSLCACEIPSQGTVINLYFFNWLISPVFRV